MKTITLIVTGLISAGLTLSSFGSSGSSATHNGRLKMEPMEPDDYAYTGRHYELETKAYVFAFRRYEPGLNRWVSPDPIGFPDGANSHVYSPVPTSSLDLWGLSTWSRSGEIKDFEPTVKVGDIATAGYRAAQKFTQLDDIADWAGWLTDISGKVRDALNAITFKPSKQDITGSAVFDDQTEDWTGGASTVSGPDTATVTFNVKVLDVGIGLSAAISISYVTQANTLNNPSSTSVMLSGQIIPKINVTLSGEFSPGVKLSGSGSANGTTLSFKDLEIRE